MKKLFLVIMLCIAASAQARTVHVRGSYSQKTGHYRKPHYQTSPDHSKLNNWSTKGNVNPYTGKRGTVDPNKAK